MPACTPIKRVHIQNFSKMMIEHNDPKFLGWADLSVHFSALLVKV
jgi:hypothetical protein